MNTASFIKISFETTITEIKADVLKHARSRIRQQSRRTWQTWINVIKKIAMQFIDGLKNYISSSNDITDREFDMLCSIKNDFWRLPSNKNEWFFVNL